MKQLVQDFIIKPTDIDEDAQTTNDPFQTAETLAFEKAKAAIDPTNPQIIIGCDTVVALKQGDTWTQFTKPTDNDDAIRILKSLRNKTHQVITGVAILTPAQTEVSHCVTDVTFNDVTDQEIEDYVKTGEPLDKAGAYGAQGMGHFLVKSLDGPFDNVVGLPLELTKILLTNVGYFEPNLS